MLYKSVFRQFSKRRLQIFLITLIMMMSAFIYVVMTYSIQALKDPTEAYFETYNQEEFHVTLVEQLTQEEQLFLGSSITQDVVTLAQLYRYDINLYDEVVQRRINQFEESYPETKVEKRLYKDIYSLFDETQHFMRILKDNQIINQSFIPEGQKPLLENQMALTRNYAEINGIAIGDIMVFDGVTYTITGHVLFPDYSLPVFGQDFILNNGTRTLGLVSDETFINLPGELNTRLSGVFLEDVSNTNTYFQTSTLDFVIVVSLTENTMRSGAIYDELAGGEAMGFMMSLLIASIAIIIVAIMIGRMLAEQRGAIGILKALGYKNQEIAKPYVAFVCLLALPGLLLGYILGLYAAEPLKQLYVTIYLLPVQPVTPTFMVFAVSIFIPLIFFMGLGYGVVLKLLNKKPLELMQPPMQKVSRIKPIFKKHLHVFKFITRIKHAYIWRHKGRLVVMFSGVFFAAYLILLSFSMINMFDRMSKDYYDQIDVKYIGYCDMSIGCSPELIEVDRVLEVPYVLLNQASVTAIGLDSETQFHPLFEKGNEITHKLDEEGIIITKSLALEQGLKVGDTVELTYGQFNMTVDILGVQDEYGGLKFYVNREALSLYLSEGQTDTLYNTVYANQPLNQTYMSIIDVDQLMLQAEELSQMVLIMSYIMIAISFGIGVIVLMLILVLAIENYFYDISLFKVIGYSKNEIKSVFVDSYLIYVIMIYILAIPMALISFEVMMWYLATQYQMIFPMALSLGHVIIGGILMAGIYYLSMFVAQQKIFKLSLQQALQVYQSA
ncbi:MAG: ABC transporter permease [Acholeplasmataceae bacterium]